MSSLPSDFFKRTLSDKMRYLRMVAITQGLEEPWRKIIDPYWPPSQTEVRPGAFAVNASPDKEPADVSSPGAASSSDPMGVESKTFSDRIKPLDDTHGACVLQDRNALAMCFGCFWPWL